MCNYSTIKEIVVPLVAALLGGGLTLSGVLITIIHENRKAKKEYLERIRPYFVVESKSKPDICKKEFIPLYVTDDSEDDHHNKTIYHWKSLLLTNVSENVCIINYVRIDDKQYNVFEKHPLKAGESCELRGWPLSCYIRDSQIKSISLGILDRQFNQYEYELSFETKATEKNKTQNVNKQNDFVFLVMDCSKNLFCRRNAKKQQRGKAK